jgi:hypothetical protein
VHQLEITARVTGGVFAIAFTYGADLYDRATVQRLADGFLARLRVLLAGPTAAPPSRAEAGVTKAGLTKHDLNVLLKQRGRS